MNSLFFPTFLEMSQSALGGTRGVDPLLLDWPLVDSPCPLLNLIPMLAFYCAFQEPDQEHLSQKSAALPLYATLVQTHLVLSHRHGYYNPWLAPKLSGYQCLRQRLAPYLLASTAAFYLSELFVLQTHPWALPRCLWALKNTAYEADPEGFRTTL